MRALYFGATVDDEAMALNHSKVDTCMLKSGFDSSTCVTLIDESVSLLFQIKKAKQGAK